MTGKVGSHHTHTQHGDTAGSVHTVKQGETLWDLSRKALVKQGVKNPSNQQIKDGVKVIEKTSRASPKKRDQFNNVKIGASHKIGKDGNRIYPGQQVLVPDMSQAAHPDKEYKWDPNQKKLVEQTDGSKAAGKVDPKDQAQVDKDAKQYETLSKEGGQDGAAERATFLKGHPSLQKYLAGDKSPETISKAAEEGRTYDAGVTKDVKALAKPNQDQVDGEVKTVNGLRGSDNAQARADYLKSRPLLAKYMQDKGSVTLGDVANEGRQADAADHAKSTTSSNVDSQTQDYQEMARLGKQYGLRTRGVDDPNVGDDTISNHAPADVQARYHELESRQSPDTKALVAAQQKRDALAQQMSSTHDQMVKEQAIVTANDPQRQDRVQLARDYVANYQSDLNADQKKLDALDAQVNGLKTKVSSYVELHAKGGN